MLSRTRFIGCLFGALLLVLSGYQRAQAASFAEIFLRPERLKAGVSPGKILLQLTPTTAATEATLSLTLDSRLTGGTHFLTDVSAYTVDATNLPSGTTALPVTGGAAQSIVGRTITFGIGDLNPGTPYAIYLTGGFPTNPPAETYLSVLTTRQADTTTIDTSNVWVASVPNDQITIGATVAGNANTATARYYQVPEDRLYSQGETLKFSIIVTSDFFSATPLTILVDWGLGTVADQTTPLIPILTYAAGSASTAYQSTPAVIDPVNRRLSWSIPSLPPGLDPQILSFELRMTDAYGGDQRVDVPINVSIIHPITTGVQTLSRSFKAKKVAQATAPTPTQSPVAALPVIRPVPQASLRVVAVEETSATVDVRIEPVNTVRVSYGTNPRSLDRKAAGTGIASLHRIALSGLTPDTVYFLRIDSGNSQGYELYTLRTARKGDQSTVITESLGFAKDGATLYTIKGKKLTTIDAADVLQIERDSIVDITMMLSHPEFFASGTLLLNDADVLGLISTEKPRPAVGFSPISIIAPGQFVARLQTPSILGLLPVQTIILSTTGARIDQVHGVIRSIEPLRIIDAVGKPIENAHIAIESFDTRSRLFQAIPSAATAMRTTAYSDEYGYVSLNLSGGQYRLTITADGYQTRQIEVILDGRDDRPYPAVQLVADGNIATHTSRFSIAILVDLLRSINNYLRSLIVSPRVQWILLAGFLSGFLLLSSEFLIRRIRRYGLSGIVLFGFARPEKEVILEVVCQTETHRPIVDAHVSVHDLESDALLAEGVTKTSGMLTLSLPKSQRKIYVSVRKLGYKNPEGPVELTTHTGTRTILFVLDEQKQSTPRILLRESIHLRSWVWRRLRELIVLVQLLVTIFVLTRNGLSSSLWYIAVLLLTAVFFVLAKREEE